MKLLVSDLDGTLYPRKEAISPTQLQENLRAVKRWVSNGNKFAVATARGMHHYPVLTEQLGFKVDFIGCNGAEIILDTGETVIKQLPCSIFIDLCQFVKENGINASVATGINNKWVWSSKDCYPKDVETYQSIWDSIEIAKLDEIDPLFGIEKIQIIVPPENRDSFKETILSKNYPVNVTTSDCNMIDIGPLDCSKGISILELCKRYEIDLENLIVAGDSENDIAMFEITKHSYCINYAEPNVIKKATRSVASLEEIIELELNKK